MLKLKPLMRTLLSALALIIALTPAVETIAAGSLHGGCGSAPSQAIHDTGADAHEAHDATMHTPAPVSAPQSGCDCGCECGPGHGCTASSTAAPATFDMILFIADALAPSTPSHPISTRVDAPLFRPPIAQLPV